MTIGWNANARSDRDKYSAQGAESVFGARHCHCDCKDHDGCMPAVLASTAWMKRRHTEWWRLAHRAIRPVTLQYVGLNECIGPECVKEFIVGHQAPGALHHVGKNRESFGRKRYSLFAAS